MEMVREYRLKQQVGVKLYSNHDMYKKMFYLMLNHSIDVAEEELRNGKYLTHEEVFGEFLADAI